MAMLHNMIQMSQGITANKHFRSQIRLFLSIMMFMSIAIVNQTIQARAHLQTETEGEEAVEANPFVPSIIPTIEEKDLPVGSQKVIPKVTSSGEVVFQRPQDKDPSTLTEEEFYKSLTPAESAILRKKPESGPAMFEAAAMIAKVGRPEFTKLLLEKFMSMSGEPAEFAAMVDRLGSDRVLYLVNHPTVGPIGAKAVEKVMTTAKEHWESRDVILAAMDNAFKGTENDRTKAMLGVRKGGNETYRVLLDMLQSKDAKQWERARFFIKFLGDDAIEALIASLESSDPKLLIPVMEILGTLKHRKIPDALLLKYYQKDLPDNIRNEVCRKAIEKQLGWLPKPEVPCERLYAEALEFFHGTRTIPHLADGNVSDWFWDVDKLAPIHHSMPVDEYYRLMAQEKAAAAYSLSFDLKDDHKKNAIKSLYMVALSEKLLYDSGLDKPIDTTGFTDIFPDPKTDELLAALELAIASGHEKGGIFPVVLLGKSGDQALCYGQGKPSLLIQAVTAPDRRLRFAALSALMRLNPQKHYIGSSRVLDSILFFTTSTGAKKVAIATNKVNDALTVGKYITSQGYQVVPVTTGGDLIQLCQNNADIDAVLATENITLPDLRTTIQTLSKDFRTADVPVAIDSQNNTYQLPITLGEKTKKSHAAALVFPYDNDSGKLILKQLADETHLEPVPASVRLAQAQMAANWLVLLLSDHANMYQIEDVEPLIRRMVDMPTLSASGLKMAIQIGTASIQNYLANRVGDVRLSEAQRRQSLETLTEHLNKYGLLLRGPDIKRLYDRYNASEKENKTSQDILSAMLDEIEKYKGKPFRKIEKQ